jgi:solute:Na+ symporter, SSS family
MSALVGFVIFYWVASISIGVFAATCIKNPRDFALAGRSLPLSIVIATVFAIWLGSGKIMAIAPTFVQDGFKGVLADPFVYSLSLILVGLFFAQRYYRGNLLPVGNFYRQRYNRATEFLISSCIVLSYVGWVSAQITALGTVFKILSGNAMSLPMGMMIGATVVLLYTVFGGMLSVVRPALFQVAIIIAGLIYIAFIVAELACSSERVINHTLAMSEFAISPAITLKDISAFIAAGVTMMFGSIVRQDVFQRAITAKNEYISAAGLIAGRLLCFLFAFIPMFLGYSASLIDPKMIQTLLGKEAHMILSMLNLNNTPLLGQVMFYGALLSAILSVASTSLIAPSIILTENVIRQFIPISDKKMLLTTRMVMFSVACVATAFALASEGTSIYDMVINAYKITLVTAFVPLVMGLYWQQATSQGALFAVISGLAFWLQMEQSGKLSIFPPQLVGLLMSLGGMIIGSLVPQFVCKPTAAFLRETKTTIRWPEQPAVSDKNRCNY